MSPRRSRFVTACQQVLALGVVLAALTPAASVVSLDVVGRIPGGTSHITGHETGFARSTAAGHRTTAAARARTLPSVAGTHAGLGRSLPG
jgi:hypothetical protein